MTSDGRPSYRFLAGAAVFLLAAILVYWLAGDILQIAGDEGIYLEGGRRVAMGQQPFRDFFALTGPLTFWIEGALAAVSGTNLIAMRLPMILEVAFLAWAVYWMLSRYANGVYSAGTALAFLACELRIRLLNVNHRWDSAALAMAATLAALAGHRTGRRVFWVFSGLLAGAAAWATPSLALLAIPLLVWSVRQHVRSGAACAAGMAGALALGAGYLQWQHALAPMIQSLLWTGANYTAPNRVMFGSVWAGTTPDVPEWQYLMVTAVLAIPAILPIAALLGWPWYWRKIHDRSSAGEIAPMLGVAVALTFAAWPRWTSDTLVHTMALPWFLCALLLYRATAPRQRLWFCGAVVVIAAASLIGKLTQPFGYVARETRVGIARDPGDQAELLDGLESRIAPGDSMFSFPYLPSAYFLLQGHNPTRYSFLQPGMMAAEDESRVIEELKADPPRWVIYEKFPAEAVLRIWPGSDRARIPMTRMNDYLRENYRPVDTVGNDRGQLTVMERATPAR